MDEAEAAARDVASPGLLSYVLRTRAAHELSGRPEAAGTLADEALHWASVAGDDWALAMAASTRALAAASPAELRDRVQWAATLLQQARNLYLLMDLLVSAAYAALCQRSDRDAREFVSRAIPIAREVENPTSWMFLQGTLGIAKLLNEDADGARDAFDEQLRLCRELRVLPLASEALLGLAAVAALCSDPQRAARLVGAAGAHRYDSPQDEVMARLQTAFLDPARRRHGTDAWDAAVREGATLGFEGAVAYALGESRVDDKFDGSEAIALVTATGPGTRAFRV
jgi:hypothetical protein